MKPKFTFIFLIGITTAVVLYAGLKYLYPSTKGEMKSDFTSSTDRGSTPTVGLEAKVHADRKSRNQSPDRKKLKRVEVPAILGISTVRIKEAQEIAEQMEANFDQFRLTVLDPNYMRRPENMESSSRMLAGRLNLGSESTRALEHILSEYVAGKVRVQAEAESKKMESEMALLKKDPEGFVNYLALQSMAARGEAFSSEQDAFYQKMRDALGNEAVSTVSVSQENWYENNDLIGKFKELLTDEQSGGLDEYIGEQRKREQEAKSIQAYMRSSQIAQTLGLNDQDREVLFQYLEQNPSASRKDIVKMVPPSVGDLLPDGM